MKKILTGIVIAAVALIACFGIVKTVQPSRTGRTVVITEQQLEKINNRVIGEQRAKYHRR